MLSRYYTYTYPAHHSNPETKPCNVNTDAFIYQTLRVYVEGHPQRFQKGVRILWDP